MWNAPPSPRQRNLAGPWTTSFLAVFAALGSLAQAASLAAPAATPAAWMPEDRAPIRIGVISGAGSQAVAAEVMLAVYQRAGVKVELISLPALRATRMVESNQLDGEVARIPAYFRRNPELLRVEPPLFEADVTAFALSDRAMTIERAEDLQGLRVGVLRGVVQSLEAVRGIKAVEQVADVRQMYRMLSSGRLDVVVDAVLNQQRYIQSSGAGHIVAVGTLGIEPVHHGLHRRHAALADRIAREIEVMAASGELAERVADAKAHYLESGRRLR